MSDQTKGCLGVAACVASLDVLQAIVRTSPVSAVAVFALVVGAAIVYGALALLIAALLDTVGLRFTSGRNAGVWYGASALVLVAGLGFALQSGRSDATTIASVSATAPGETAARPNILLITMDTTRRDGALAADVLVSVTKAERSRVLASAGNGWRASSSGGGTMD